MKFSAIILAVLVLLVGRPATSSAHFLWIVAGSQAKDGQVHVYFSDAASPDDADLLNKVASLQLWQLNKDGQATPLKTTKGTESLTAAPAAGEEPVYALSHDYGVISRGAETFRLKYYAKSQPAKNPQQWRAIANAERLPLEVAAGQKDSQLVLTVLWQGKPVAGSTVTVNGPGIETKWEATTNDQGQVTFESKSSGLFSIRAKHTETATGEAEGKTYTSIRHYSTLALTLGEPTTTAATGISATEFAQLDPGITSFGAAIVDHSVYVYGGHFGKPHHYSTEGQSDQLLRLNLSQPAKWEVVSSGPKRTGLAAVAHGGKFYRIGGFEARNTEADKQSLWSMPDFARFDPQTNKWEQLTPLPAGRSSHDAVVIGNTLYVIGGWELQGEGQSKWHDTAYSMDLSAEKLEWQALPKHPFQRRALSLGEHQGKVYVIGGMQPEGGPTTTTAIFDPKSQTWSDGPKLNGEAMEGFGSSSFLCGNRLCVTTFAGNLQVLSEDGSAWVNAGKLAHPRFFHRMLPLGGARALIVGGASMQQGKIRELETLIVTTGAASD